MSYPQRFVTNNNVGNRFGIAPPTQNSLTEDDDFMSSEQLPSDVTHAGTASQSAAFKEKFAHYADLVQSHRYNNTKVQYVLDGIHWHDSPLFNRIRDQRTSASHSRVTELNADIRSQKILRGIAYLMSDQQLQTIMPDLQRYLLEMSRLFTMLSFKPVKVALRDLDGLARTLCGDQCVEQLNEGVVAQLDQDLHACHL